MMFTSTTGRIIWAAALLTIPSVSLAQDNVANNVTADTAVANDTLVDPALNVTTANDLETTGVPVDDTLANDMAMAETAAPVEDDRDFPWGLLGLLGLAGLLGRKKKDHHVDSRTDRRDV